MGGFVQAVVDERTRRTKIPVYVHIMSNGELHRGQIKTMHIII
eukprot:SAG11_NODE_6258_length_1350_cov_2.597122_2_plen_42_part_01